MTDLHRFDPVRIARFDELARNLYDDPRTDKSAVARRHRDLLDAVTPFDVLGLKRFADDDPAAIGRIKEEAGRFVHLFFAGLTKFAWNRDVHPALTALRRENAAVVAAVELLKPLFGKLGDASARAALAVEIGRFATLERKFRKAELLLHPALDAHLPSPVPLKVLWSLHDDIRAVVAALSAALVDPATGADVLAETVGRFHYLVVGLTEKEELILYPAAAILLAPSEWDSIGREMPGFGFAFGADPEPVLTSREPLSDPMGRFSVRSGSLDFAQLALILDALPVEMTFIDEAGITRYFNETKEKLFTRTPQILGRPVENCHPQKSVPVVRKLLAAFAAGTADRAEMWFPVRDRFIHIIYSAIRDADGTYRGTLETVQDLTRLRLLQGSKETLDF